MEPLYLAAPSHLTLRYQNRCLEAAQVILELIKMANQMWNAPSQEALEGARL